MELIVPKLCFISILLLFFFIYTIHGGFNMNWLGLIINLVTGAIGGISAGARGKKKV